MRPLVALLVLMTLTYSCDSSKSSMKGVSDSNAVENDTIHISNPDLEYEIIIIEPGFDSWLLTQHPREFYNLSYLENKNMIYTSEYNRRVHDTRYSTILYQQEIYYDPMISYGMEVNYLLYNYFKYFEVKYKQRF